MPSLMTYDVLKYHHGVWDELSRAVIVEHPLSLTVNGEILTVLMCTPTELEALALGFLYNEGLIAALDDVAEIHLCEDARNIDIWLRHEITRPHHWRRTSGCVGGVTADRETEGAPLDADFRLTPDDVAALFRILSAAQVLYVQAGGVHTSVLSDGKQALLSAEDVGRHNSLDKLAGLLLKDPSRRAAARVLLTTGRISSEMLQKAYRMGIPVVISRTAPSSLAVERAVRDEITLIGYARPHRFIVYSHPERIVRTEKNWPVVA